MQDAFFYIFAALTLLCGFLVVANPFSRSPVTSAMFLVLTIVAMAGLFVLLHAFFLAAVQVLVYAGAVPRTDWLAGMVERDAQGYLISGQHLMLEGKRPSGWGVDRDPFYLETSVPGIFVAGDVRHRSAKGVTSGVGEGAMAVKLVHQYLGLL